MKRILFSVSVILLAFVFVGTSFAQASTHESPMLRTLVTAGKLPPLKSRLPDKPYVVHTLGGASKALYGGILQLIRVDPFLDPDGGYPNAMNDTLLAMPGWDGTYGAKGDSPLPHLVAGLSVSSDTKEFTFTLRKGLKWSDGVPLTADDFAFAWEVLHDTNITPAFPKSFTTAGGEPTFTVVDPLTVKYTFKDSYGGFAELMTTMPYNFANDPLFLPKHYLMQFLPKYADAAKLDSMIAAANYNKGEYWRLFAQKRDTDPGIPVLTPWVITDRSGGFITWQRNPYYWKVDENGNQLPYLDGMKSTLIRDPTMAPLKALAGEVDFLREQANLTDVPLYKQYEKKGGYVTVLYNKDVETGELLLNMSNPDPVYAKVIGDVRVRQALSLAINRDEIIKGVYLGLAQPGGYVDPTYDPAKANQLLDQAGLDKKDANGMRLGPDGNVFTIPFEIPTLMGFEVPATTLVIDMWKKVGISATFKTVTFALWDQLIRGNQIHATIHWMDPAYDVKATPAKSGGPFSRYAGSWAPAWNDWHDSNGTLGIEPPPLIKQLFQDRDMALTGNDAQRLAAGADELKIIHDNYLWIGLTQAKAPIIYSAKLRGTAPAGVTSFLPFVMLVQCWFAK